MIDSKLYFSPDGRVTPAQLQTAALVLIGAGFILTILPLISLWLSPVGLLGLVLAWCWVVLLVKRMRDAGRPGWHCLIPIVGFIIAYLILNRIVDSIFMPRIADQVQKDVLEAITSGDSRKLIRTAGTLKTTILPTAIMGAALSYAVVILTNRFFPSAKE